MHIVPLRWKYNKNTFTATKNNINTDILGNLNQIITMARKQKCQLLFDIFLQKKLQSSQQSFHTSATGLNCPLSRQAEERI